MSKKFQEISEFSEIQRICEFCNNKSRYHDFPSQGIITCGCEAPKIIHDECLFKKLDPITKSYYLNIKDLVCETCNSKILLNGTFYTYHKVNGLLDSILNYKDSVLNGVFKEYDYDGESLIKMMTYVNGKVEGLSKFWSRNKEGIRFLEAEENYLNGLLEGISIYYDSDGAPVEKILYKENSIVERFCD